ncbi:hypothetical protein JRO89_XS05G0098500 [Xanthoceras sorbifolium]|uniref:Protein kinase domain-containing protein n=1 Tax=Xanthoceras sorbifolium TaxID=99658 RepID=A0ABQ8I1S9_9ROSI|nr:hypothetical protein JRO89_XS05G0098500 [Xanthoceras sorbifolium]
MGRALGRRFFKNNENPPSFEGQSADRWGRMLGDGPATMKVDQQGLLVGELELFLPVSLKSFETITWHRLQVNLQLHLPAAAAPKISDRSSFCYLPKNVPNKSNTMVQETEKMLDFEKMCVLGHGNYGIVYKVRHKRTSAIYALKIIRD